MDPRRPAGSRPSHPRHDEREHRHPLGRAEQHVHVRFAVAGRLVPRRAGLHPSAQIAVDIRCPTLVIDTEAERAFAGQAKALYDALTCEKTFLLFTAQEGAEDHCQAGSSLLSAQRTFDGLEETLTRTPSTSTA
jgi:hypothetical protein